MLLAVLFFLLDWTALHDIIKGNEPGYTAEYTIVGLSILFYFTLAYFLLKKKKAITAN